MDKANHIIKILNENRDFIAKIVDIELNQINGGSIQIIAAHKYSKIKQNIEKINKMIEYEEKYNVSDEFSKLRENIIKIKIDLTGFIISEKEKGKSIYIYGC